PTLDDNRIRAGPPPQPARVIPRPVVVETCLFIPLLACVAVAFQAYLCGPIHSLKRSYAVGVVLLIGDQCTVVVQLQPGRAEMIAELVADHGFGICDWSAKFVRFRLDE